MSNKDIKIYGTLLNYTTDNIIAYANQIYDEDYRNGTMQNIINQNISAIVRTSPTGRTSIDSDLLITGTTTCANIDGGTIHGNVGRFDTLSVSGASTFTGDVTASKIIAENIELSEDIIAEGGHFHDVYAGETHTSVLSPFDSSSRSITVFGDLIPERDMYYNLGTSEMMWKDVSSDSVSTRLITVNLIRNGRGSTDIQVSGSFVPATPEHFSLGTSQYRWGTVYAKNIDATTINGTNINNLISDIQSVSEYVKFGNGAIQIGKDNDDVAAIEFPDVPILAGDFNIVDSIRGLQNSFDNLGDTYYTKSEIDEIVEDIEGGTAVIPDPFPVNTITKKDNNYISIATSLMPTGIPGGSLGDSGHRFSQLWALSVHTESVVPSSNNNNKIGLSSSYWQDAYITNLHTNSLKLGETTDGGTSYYGEISYTNGNLVIGGQNVDAIKFESDDLVFGNVHVLSKIEELEATIAALQEQLDSTEFTVRYDSSVTNNMGTSVEPINSVYYKYRQSSDDEYTRLDTMSATGVSFHKSYNVVVRIAYNAVTAPENLKFIDAATGAVDTTVSIFPTAGEQNAYDYTISSINKNYIITYTE